MKTVTIISGWAHGIKSIKSLGNALNDEFNVKLITSAEVLHTQTIPESNYIIAESMGGLLAIEHLPPSCKKIILISTTAKFCATQDYPHGTPEKVLRRMIAKLKNNPKDVLNDFYAHVSAPNPPIRTDPETDLHHLISGLEYLLNSDVRNIITTLKIPTLLLHGELDQIIPLTAAKWANKNLPNSYLKVFEKSGHALHAHHLNKVVAEIKKFLI